MWILSEAVESGKQGMIPVSPSAASPGAPLASALGRQRGWRLQIVLWVLRCIMRFRVHPAGANARPLLFTHGQAASPGQGKRCTDSHLSTRGLGPPPMLSSSLTHRCGVGCGVMQSGGSLCSPMSSLSVTNLRSWAQVNLQPVWRNWSLQGCSPDLTFLWAQKQQSSYDHHRKSGAPPQAWAEVRASIQPTPWWGGGWLRQGSGPAPSKSALPCSLCCTN